MLYNQFFEEYSEELYKYLVENFSEKIIYQEIIHRELSQNPNIMWKIIQANPDKPWDYVMLSSNPNITLEIVQDSPDKSWSYWGLSANPNITWEIVLANRHHDWDYLGLYQNPMPTRRDNYIRKCFQKHFMSIGLAEELMANVWHPGNFEKFQYLDPETFGEE